MSGVDAALVSLNATTFSFFMKFYKGYKGAFLLDPVLDITYRIYKPYSRHFSENLFLSALV